MSAALQPRLPSRMTLDEFLSWEPDGWGDTRWQLIDGEPVAMSPARRPHGAIQSELARLIGNHLLETSRPCAVVTEPGIVPALHATENFRIPDLAVTCAPPDDTVMVPDPVLLVEVMSPNNRAATRANLWAYATILTVMEILVVQSTRVEAELLRRDEGGNWPGNPERIGQDGTLELRSIGFAVPLRAVYRTTHLAR